MGTHERACTGSNIATRHLPNADSSKSRAGSAFTNDEEEPPQRLTRAEGDLCEESLETDYWTISGDCLVRYTMKPRTSVFFPTEENLPVLMKYIDVQRFHHTNLDSQSEAWIADYWPCRTT